jgi:hypothetical protein
MAAAEVVVEVGPTAGPYVMPGTYTIALVAGSRTLDSKPMRIIMDPEVRVAEGARRRADEVALELHDLQRRGQATANTLNTLYTQMTAAAAKIRGLPSPLPADVNTQWTNFQRDFDSLRVKFGVPLGGAGGGRGGGGGGGGRGGGAADNALGRVATMKGLAMGIWEPASDATVRQSNDAKQALQKAIADANAFLRRASSMSETMKRFDVSIAVPPQ